jgi:sugar phosphate isomerase/epimerase
MGFQPKSNKGMTKSKQEPDTMNLFVSTTFFPDGTGIGEALEICSENGITQVELGSNHSFSEGYKKTIKAFKGVCLVHNYFPIPREPFVLNLASADESIFRKSVQHVQDAIDFCEETGALLYTFHPGFLTDPKGANINNANYDFQWDDSSAIGKEYEKAYSIMLRGIEYCVNYAAKKKIRVAIETEGSFKRKQHLLMQRPEEYERLFTKFSVADLGVNLNIGHLKLASEAFGFSPAAFSSLVADYIVAMELSHNDGLEDQHLPLVEEAWYWPIILDPRVMNAFKILEYRNVNVEAMVASIGLYKTKCHEVQLS